MAKYKMKFFGSLVIDGSTVSFDEGDVIECDSDITDEMAEKLESERKSVKRGRKKAETTALEPDSETR